MDLFILLKMCIGVESVSLQTIVLRLCLIQSMKEQHFSNSWISLVSPAEGHLMGELLYGVVL